MIGDGFLHDERHVVIEARSGSRRAGNAGIRWEQLENRKTEYTNSIYSLQERISEHFTPYENSCWGSLQVCDCVRRLAAVGSYPTG